MQKVPDTFFGLTPFLAFFGLTPFLADTFFGPERRDPSRPETVQHPGGMCAATNLVCGIR
jgi:hypothetical protein